MAHLSRLACSTLILAGIPLTARANPDPPLIYPGRAENLTGIPVAQAGPSPAPSPKSSGWYFGVSGGIQSRERAGESDTTFTLFKGGYLLNAAVGYRFSPDIRLELEYTYFDNANQVVAATETGPAPGLGSISGNAYMLNLFYDFVIEGSAFKPYISFGVGIFNTSIKGLANTILASLDPPLFVNSVSEAAFAFQFRLGTSYVINQQWDLFAGYRYFNGSTLTFNNTIFGTLRPDGAKLHSFELGARYYF